MTIPPRPRAARLLVASMLVTIGLSESQSYGSDPSASKWPTSEIRHPETDEMFGLFPQSYTKHPGLPSPWKASDGREILVGRTGDGRFTLLPVTVENDKPIDWQKSRFNKGRQIDVDERDFPALAATGLVPGSRYSVGVLHQYDLEDVQPWQSGNHGPRHDLRLAQCGPVGQRANTLDLPVGREPNVEVVDGNGRVDGCLELTGVVQ